MGLTKNDKVAVIGAGTMGSGIAQLAATYGHQTVVYDASEKSIEKSQIKLDKITARLVEKGKFDEAKRNDILGNINYSNNIEDVKNILDTEQDSHLRPPLEDEDEEEEYDEDDEEEEEEEIYSTSRRELNDNDSVLLGIVYVIVELNDFFKKAETYEPELIILYHKISENELDIRNKRMATIQEKAESFIEYSRMRIDEIATKEKALNQELLEYTTILSNVSKLKKTTEKDDSKYAANLAEIEKIQHQTQKTIHELNIELLRLRDEADELLTNYTQQLDEMMEL